MLKPTVNTNSAWVTMGPMNYPALSVPLVSEDESLMPTSIVVVSEGSCDLLLTTNLNVASALLESS